MSVLSFWHYKMCHGNSSAAWGYERIATDTIYTLPAFILVKEKEISTNY